MVALFVVLCSLIGPSTNPGVGLTIYARPDYCPQWGEPFFIVAEVENKTGPKLTVGSDCRMVRGLEGNIGEDNAPLRASKIASFIVYVEPRLGSFPGDIVWGIPKDDPNVEIPDGQSRLIKIRVPPNFFTEGITRYRVAIRHNGYDVGITNVFKIEVQPRAKQ
jgi:hypothetical protein